ncbi:MAG TPA: hypothetical protein VFT56_13285 [Sphingomonas sp.]|nr:hypothetical protein [Sphingomonas sp.]
MNETGIAAPVTPDNAGLFTAAHLGIIVILVIAAILVIWWGSRLRARHRSERDAGKPAATAERTATPAPVEPPVAPPPPPLADTTTGALVEPESAAPTAPPPPADGEAGKPVTLLKGLGPKVAARLAELGITTVGQIAALSPAEAEALDAELGAFRGRMARDRWIEQAQLLAAGDRAGFEARFGKLG